MDNGILEFKKRLDENEINEKLNAENTDSNGLYRELLTSCNIHNFGLCSIPTTFLSLHYPRVLITLDDEDIEYFKKKYLDEEVINGLIAAEKKKEEAEELYRKELEELNRKFNK